MTDTKIWIGRVDRSNPFGPEFDGSACPHPQPLSLGRGEQEGQSNPPPFSVLVPLTLNFETVKWPPSAEALLGPLSLALQTGGLHVKRRKLLAQAFQPRALDSYIPTIEAISDRYCQAWVVARELTWYPQLRRYTLDIACKLFVGLDRGSDSALGQLFEIWSQGLFSIPLNLPWTRFGKSMCSRRKLLAELERLIRDRQAAVDGEANTDALGLLLQARDDDGERLSIEELKDRVLLLLFAGHETLTSPLTSFCLAMTQYPEVQARARAEQVQLGDRPLSLDTLKQMTYLENVLKEVLRFIPPVGGGFREVLQSCDYGGYQFPKGWAVLYGINQTHRDRSVFADPDALVKQESDNG
ncbi:cytochrome P450 [Synechococcus sp. PCC 7336]|uniref:cytochrome P450 n=1 Tax=Synechococcus sp. PCC 7336 TaxID=195250 RepID=UPI001D0D7867|nr:cytochrome P450 [Synechococcus sp. PCC 7336]